MGLSPLPLLVGNIGSGRGPGGCKLLIQTPPSMTLGNWIDHHHIRSGSSVLYQYAFFNFSIWDLFTKLIPMSKLQHVYFCWNDFYTVNP